MFLYHKAIKLEINKSKIAFKFQNICKLSDIFLNNTTKKKSQEKLKKYFEHDEY